MFVEEDYKRNAALRCRNKSKGSQHTCKNCKKPRGCSSSLGKNCRYLPIKKIDKLSRLLQALPTNVHGASSSASLLAVPSMLRRIIVSFMSSCLEDMTAE